MKSEHAVEAHYSHGGLLETLLDALRRAGIDPGQLGAEDLVAVEEFHIGGRQATAHLADVMGVTAGTRLLDVGSGIGGAARYFALEHGCDVVGIDLTEEFCTVAEDLSARLGLSERTRFVHGSALDLPFEDASFDDACMLHVGMNIEDKERLLDEVSRVLRPAGRFAVYDVLAGSAEPHFPVPWAQDASTSFLVSADELCALMESCGFEVVAQDDRTEAGLVFFRELAAAREAGTAPAVAVPILMGDDGPERLANTARSLEEGRIRPWLIIGKKAS